MYSSVIVCIPPGMLELSPNQACDNTGHEWLDKSSTYRVVLLDLIEEVRVDQYCMYYYRVAGRMTLILVLFSGDACHFVCCPHTGTGLLTAFSMNGCHARSSQCSPF